MTFQVEKPGQSGGLDSLHQLDAGFKGHKVLIKGSGASIGTMEETSEAITKLLDRTAETGQATDTASASLTNAQTTIQHLRKELAVAKEETDKLQTTVNDRTKIITTLSDHKRTLKGLITNKELEISQLKETLRVLKETSTAEQEKSAATNLDLNEQINQLTQEKVGLELKLQETNDRLVSTERELSETHLLLTKFVEKTTDLTKQVVSLTEEVESIRSKAQALSEKAKTVQDEALKALQDKATKAVIPELPEDLDLEL